MNRSKRRYSNRNAIKKQKKVIRCRSKMLPVLESEKCENFRKKDKSNTNNNCKNCIHSF